MYIYSFRRPHMSSVLHKTLKSGVSRCALQINVMLTVFTSFRVRGEKLDASIYIYTLDNQPPLPQGTSIAILANYVASSENYRKPCIRMAAL